MKHASKILFQFLVQGEGVERVAFLHELTLYLWGDVLAVKKPLTGRLREVMASLHLRPMTILGEELHGRHEEVV